MTNLCPKTMPACSSAVVPCVYTYLCNSSMHTYKHMHIFRYVFCMLCIVVSLFIFLKSLVARLPPIHWAFRFMNENRRCAPSKIYATRNSARHSAAYYVNLLRTVRLHVVAQSHPTSGDYGHQFQNITFAQSDIHAHETLPRCDGPLCQVVSDQRGTCAAS